MSVTVDDTAVVDSRAVGALPDAGADAALLWTRATRMAADELPGMGLAAGERPAADVEILCSAVAVVEFELARRMHAAAVSGSLPLVGAGALPLARGWSAGWARRLARAGEFAAGHPGLAAVWAAGVITSEHVWAIGRHAEALSAAEMAGVIEELGPLWGRLSPRAVGLFVERVIRMLHPPSDPEPGEWDAHEGRFLSFAVTDDSVILSGSLPRVEGEAVIAAVEAFAERLRSEADHVPAAARRADGLVALVNAAHATGSIPTRGGLPVSVSVTLETTSEGDQQWTTSRGHTLTSAEQRFTSCDAQVTPIVLRTSASTLDRDRPERVAEGGGVHPRVTAQESSAANRISALATTLLGTRMPLAVGRTARTATPAQRRALAARDGGCVIPGCEIPAEACQTHHLHEWSAGGRTEDQNLVLLCWAHHRQVDLAMWRITPAIPDDPIPRPLAGAPPGTPWPANNSAPCLVTRQPRTRWRT